MRPNFSGGCFKSPQDGYQAFEVTPSFGRKRIFVLSVQGIGPIPYNDVLMASSRHFPIEGELENSKAPHTPALGGRHLDQVLAEDAGGDSYWARPVLGRVVKDSQGQLCEWTSQGLRPLGRVARDPQGQLLELLPFSSPAESAGKMGEIIDGELVEPSSPANSENRAEEASRIATQRTERSSDFRSRRFFANPGLPRVVELGRFRALLASQLSHPERLRDPHRLACHVQIYESLLEQRADEFFEAIQRDAAPRIPIRPLDSEAIAVLGLAPFLQRHPHPVVRASRAPSFIQPFERFFSLRVISDPTADASTSAKATKPAVSNDEVASRVPERPVQSAIPVATDVSPRLKEIPHRFQNPWEFQLTRDEALYDMGIDKLSSSSFHKLLSRIGGWAQRRREFRKWSALLNGKSMEDQLWGVRPPSNAIGDVTIREWARQTLELAGYDPASMMLEWEIFWRRKGVKNCTGGKRK
jgi:hypothetical protein